MPTDQDAAQWYTAGGYVDAQLREQLKRFTLAWQYGGLVSWNRLPDNAKATVRERLAQIRGEQCEPLTNS